MTRRSAQLRGNLFPALLLGAAAFHASWHPIRGRFASPHCLTSRLDAARNASKRLGSPAGAVQNDPATAVGSASYTADTSSKIMLDLH